MEMRFNHEPPQEKRTFLELAARCREQALKARQELEKFQLLLQVNEQATAEEKARLQPNKEFLAALEDLHDSMVKQFEEWLKIQAGFDRLANNYEIANDELRN